MDPVACILLSVAMRLLSLAVKFKICWLYNKQLNRKGYAGHGRLTVLL